MLVLPALPAKAAAIQNLSCTPQTIEVESGNGSQSIVIPPGKTFHGVGDVNVRYRGREVRVEYNMEYAIWDDGTFGPQRTLRHHGGGFFMR